MGYDPSYAQYIDHTVLKADTTRETLLRFCNEAKQYGFASVCVNPCNIAFVSQQLKGSGVKTAAVVGFPLGANKSAIKAAEAREAIADGADEIDMVINIGALKDGRLDYVREDIRAVVEASHPQAIVKAIIEESALTPEEIAVAARLVMEAGADFVKTSTGKIDVAATPEAAVVMCQAIKDYYEKTSRKVGFKAAGGVRTPEDAALYYTIVERILGKEWLTTDLFRIGASSAANNLLSAIVGESVKHF